MLLIVFFSVASPNFLEVDNLVAILQATAVNGVLAVACTYVIITSGIDLSVGTLMTFCAVMAGVVLTKWGCRCRSGSSLRCVSRALSGSVSGFVIAKMKVPPFIATLGMMMLLKGLSLVISGTRPIYFNDTPGFTSIAQDSLIGNLIPALPIPNAVLILFLVAIGASIVLNRTIFGRYTFALGSNEEALRLSGVNVDAWKIAVYTFSGAVCGIAGLLIASRLNSAQPALGQGYEARCDRGRRDRRHVAVGRRGQHRRHHHRRVHHERADERPAHHVGRAGMADGRDGRDHHPRRLRRHPAPAR